MKHLDWLNVIETVVFVYIGFGLLWAIYFFYRVLNDLEPNSPTSSRGFRLAILPGVILFWPLVLVIGLSLWKPAQNHRSFNHWRKFQSPVFMILVIFSLILIFTAARFRDPLKSSPIPAELRTE